MQTRWIMSSSAILLGAHGIVLLFAPELLPQVFGLVFTPETLTGVQLFGGSLFGFGMMNWIARNSILGGIYGRALVMGNFAHAMIGFLTVARAALNGFGNTYFWCEVLMYGAFAFAFTMMLFKHPGGQSKDGP